jgi:hypothetical protein
MLILTATSSFPEWLGCIKAQAMVKRAECGLYDPHSADFRRRFPTTSHDAWAVADSMVRGYIYLACDSLMRRYIDPDAAAHETITALSNRLGQGARAREAPAAELVKHRMRPGEGVLEYGSRTLALQERLRSAGLCPDDTDAGLTRQFYGAFVPGPLMLQAYQLMAANKAIKDGILELHQLELTINHYAPGALEPPGAIGAAGDGGAGGGGPEHGRRRRPGHGPGHGRGRGRGSGRGDRGGRGRGDD